PFAPGDTAEDMWRAAHGSSELGIPPGIAPHDRARMHASGGLRHRGRSSRLSVRSSYPPWSEIAAPYHDTAALSSQSGTIHTVATPPSGTSPRSTTRGASR